MIVYEVNVDFPLSIADQYRAWLAHHVREMLELPGFVSADVHDVEADPINQASRAQMCVQYRLQDANALSNYLETYAPAMRGDAIKHFGDAVNATRRVLWPVVQMLAPYGKLL
jgi:hypothetical protein